MSYKKIRVYPPIILIALVALTFTVASINLEVGRQMDKQSQEIVQATSATDLVLAQPTLEATTEPETDPTYTSACHMTQSLDLDAEDTERLMRIAMAEAEGESTVGKALVMLVVLNRVWSDEFPNTIEEVIFQPGQFSVTEEGGRYYTTEPDDGCWEAFNLVNAGWDESQGALYFESCKSDSWHSRNLEYLFQEGNHKFYR